MAQEAAKKASSNKVAAFLKENMGIIGALLVLCVFLAVFPATSGSFLTSKNKIGRAHV